MESAFAIYTKINKKSNKISQTKKNHGTEFPLKNNTKYGAGSERKKKAKLLRQIKAEAANGNLAVKKQLPRKITEPLRKNPLSNKSDKEKVRTKLMQNGNVKNTVSKSRSESNSNEVKKHKSETFIPTSPVLPQSDQSDEEIPLLIPINETGDDTDSILNGNMTKIDLTKDDPCLRCFWAFQMLTSPYEPKDFLEQYWEKQSLFIRRNNKNYYKGILSTELLDKVIRNYPLRYGRNVDVVVYENGVKEVLTPNDESRVVPAELWDYYSNGCSIRILNPQSYVHKVHVLLASLQEYFGTMVGANVYLTPPGSQGFAPHFDDIEAFIVQLEGRKHWKLYKPEENFLLARDSSKNFKPEEIGQPFMEVTLNAGDLLYFPRGTIHEGYTDAEAHSLHITVSVYQHTAYADLLEHVLPAALKKAAQNDCEFRKGLPINYLKHLGCINKKKISRVRTEILRNVKSLLSKLDKYLDVDHGADLLGKKFMHDAMPPVITNSEAQCCSKYDGDFMMNGEVYNRAVVTLDWKIRLLRYYALRLVTEEDSTQRIYFCTDNAKVYHGEEEQWMELLTTEHGEAIKFLQNVYPNFVNVEELPISEETNKLLFVAQLWEKGLIVTSSPLDGEDYQSSNSS